MNLYEQRRKEAQQRLLDQMDARQRYVDQQQQKDEQEAAAQAAAEAEYAHQQEMAAPGNRELDFAGKGLAAGGPYGALVGAFAARAANAYDAYNGNGPTKKKGLAGAFRAMTTLEDLKRGVQSKQGSAMTGNLAGAAGQYRARQQTAGSGNTAWSQGEKDRIAASDQRGRDNLALQRMAAQDQQANHDGGFKFSDSTDVEQAQENSALNDPQTLEGNRKLRRPVV